MMDMNGALNDLKKHIFFEFLNLVGRAFVLVRYSDNVILGNRGFTAEEKDNGIVLVFNPKMNFSWDDYGITVTLVFGTSPQKCFIPVDDIIAVYSPEINSQFLVAPQQPQQPQQIKQQQPKAEVKGRKAEGKSGKREYQSKAGNVITVDFTKKR